MTTQIVMPTPPLSLTGHVAADAILETGGEPDYSALTWEQHENYVKGILAECTKDAENLYNKISNRLYPALLALEHRYKNERYRNDIHDEQKGWYAYLESIGIKPDTFRKWKRRHKDVEQLCLPPKPKPAQVSKTAAKPEDEEEPKPITEEIESLKNQIADLQHQNAMLAVQIEDQAAAPILRSLLEKEAAKLRVSLAMEPDQYEASKMLTQYLASVAATFENDRIRVSDARATITLKGREGYGDRILPGDWLRHKRGEKPVLAKCTGIGEFLHRRRAQDFIDGQWQKEHVVVSEYDYTVIREDVARELEPAAFEAPKKLEVRAHNRTEPRRIA